MEGAATGAVVRGYEPASLPPTPVRGPLAWMRQRLFSSPFNTLLTLLLAWAGYEMIAFIVDWTIFDAVWTGSSAKDCPYGTGACWPYVTGRFHQLIYGGYPRTESWRVDVVFMLGALSLACFMVPLGRWKMPARVAALVVFPIASFVLLVGGAFGLRYVSTHQWGGLMLTLVVASTGILFSVPLGLVLALGRFSELPVIRFAATTFIEFWRALPLIAVLFSFVILFPLFTPRGWDVDMLVRTIVCFAVFNSAYMAEVFRGGLQSIPKSQFEAARSIGLTWRQMMSYIVLPQAIRNSVPALVSMSISIFKETSIVLLIGLTDLLGVVQGGTRDPNWLGGPQILATGYVFAALIYVAFTYSMSHYSRGLENRQNIT
jgi:general L-amino acid transport system permease protein